jgi:putative transcriptional regulator
MTDEDAAEQAGSNADHGEPSGVVSLAGHLLVATPMIFGPPFERSVVFLSEHDHEGAIGVIVNSPSRLTVAEVLPDLTEFATDPKVVHVGGPVQTDTAIVVAQSQLRDFARGTAIDDVGIVDPTEPPIDTQALRVFAGYSGWEPGQLEAEIVEGSWWWTPATSRDVFCSDTGSLWEEAVRRLPGPKALYATYPTDPLLN